MEVVNDIISVLDSGVQSLPHNYLMYSFKIKFSGSQCLGTKMTSSRYQLRSRKFHLNQN
ncbi:hypothetical protein [Wolbachia endosymbiont of Wuchereria bancrofti]|uniref:hypothetical protein n=1 Tax=Wolbachia endosymbiont of Wuchereria bancrofti TaxID=96496 RepID=UPI00397D18C6